MSKEDVEYILDAVLFIAEQGWKFLGLYRCNYKTGEWAHTTRLTRFPERKWLSNFNISDNSTDSNVGSIINNIVNDNDKFLPVHNDKVENKIIKTNSPLENNLLKWGVSSPSELLKKIAGEECINVRNVCVRVYLCIYMYTHVYICIYMCTYAYIYIYVYIYMYM
jgi:hypothetical protein